MNVSGDSDRYASGTTFADSFEREHALRIGRAWVELRRGAWTHGFREYVYGAGHTLEQGQMDALDLLVRRDRSMRQLAERLRVEPSTATRAAQSLVDAGLAERFRSPDDGRLVLLRATPAGRARHAEVDARRSHAMALILDAFTAEERADLAGLLERLVSSIDDVCGRLDSHD
ncbi:MAG: MarR family transcriptional regulator [Actinomycetota bacterium]